MKSELEDLFIDVVLGIPLTKPLSYRVPGDFRSDVEVGKRVLVPLGKRKVTGYVLGTTVKPQGLEIKDIIEILDDQPLFTPHHLAFYRWISEYYFSPLGEVIKTALPASINVNSRQMVSLTEKGMTGLCARYDGPTSQLLQALAGKKVISLKALQKMVGKETVNSLLARLERDGLIQREFQGRTAVAAKKERWITLAERGYQLLKTPQLLEGWARKVPRQAALLRFVGTSGTVSQALIRKTFGSCTRLINALQKNGYIRFELREIFRDPLSGETALCEERKDPTPEQRQVLKKIREAVVAGGYAPFYLHGVTGSGKTEVYMASIEAVLAHGKEALVLVPEIALTPQLVSRFRARFGDVIAVLHSRLSPGERYDGWRRIIRGLVKIAIGTRSAIFAPFTRLGIIVVDEEHDLSYKQEEKLKYNARDLALVRARMDRAVVILGSATPSVDSYFNARSGKLTLLQLTRRVADRPLPRIELVDMKQEALHLHRCTECMISRRLQEALAVRVARNQQSLLFLNRRGFAPYIICRECGYVFGCPNCSVSLIHHQRVKKLQCHYCGYAVASPDVCPRCGGIYLKLVGRGTERLEDEIRAMLPQASVARMDRDTTRGKGGHKRVLSLFSSSAGGILIGTQMVAKGHDLPGITLVGVISADASLHFPDFRASERTFQLLTQVAGRAGRGNIPGEVIIQTFNPSHYSITAAQRQDFQLFYEEEIKFRRELNYPPFSRIINFRIEGTSKTKTAECAERLGRLAHVLLSQDTHCPTEIEILGPAAAPWEKIKGKYRFQMVVKGSSLKALRAFATQLIHRLPELAKGSGTSFSVDVDPVSLL